MATAVGSVDRHLVLFKIEIRDALLQDTNQQVMRKLILITEPSGRNRIQAVQEVLVCFVPLRDGCERIVIQPVVIAIITESSRPLREISEVGLILLLEERVLLGDSLSRGFHALRNGGNTRSDEKDRRKEDTHGFIAYQRARPGQR